MTKNDYIEELHKLIESKRFIKHGYSWFALTEQHFYKIPLFSKNVKADSARPEALELIQEEYQHAMFLSQLDEAMEKPLALLEKYACLVKKRIFGKDLLLKLRTSSNKKEHQKWLEEGISIIARIHRHKDKLKNEVSVYDYGKWEFSPLTPKQLEILKSHPPHLIVQGFEIRNLIHENNKLISFDPHSVCLGVPEDDVSRYVLSILMVNWGSRLKCIVWKNFDFNKLLKVYEETRGEKTDKNILSMMFDWNIAMRDFYAKKKEKRLPLYLRILAVTYRRIYFWQIENWRKKEGI